MHCQTNGIASKTLPEAGFDAGVSQKISNIFHVPAKEMQKYGRAFLSTCDLSLTGSIVSHYGEIPEMAGDPKAAGKECIVWEALYQSKAAADEDRPLNSFVVVCDSARAEGRTSSPTVPLSQTAQA